MAPATSSTPIAVSDVRSGRLRLRTRLAWIFGTGFAVLLGLVFAVLYAWTASEMRANFDRRLLEDVRAGQQLYLAERAEFPTAREALTHALSELRYTDRVFYAIGADGALVSRSPLLPGQPDPVPAEALAVRPDGVPFDAGSGRQRVAGLPLGEGSTRLFVATSLDPLDELLSRLRLGLGFGLPIVVLLGGMLGAWGSGFALRPIRRLATEAVQIGEAVVAGESAPGGLPESGPPDEIRAVAGTINRLLDRLSRALSAERELGRRQRDFMADAAHELRMPIAVLRSEVEVALEGGAIEPAGKVVLESVAHEANRLSSLVDDLLLLSRGDAMARPGVERLLYLDDVVHRSVARLRPLPIARDREIRIGDFEAAPVLGDPDLLERAVTALVHNALVHAGPSPVEVRSGVASRDAGDASWVEIRDWGPGVAEDQRGRIFDRFVRLDSSRSGSGLGLAIATEVARLHGGRLSLESTVGEGSAFRIEIPSATRSASREIG